MKTGASKIKGFVGKASSLALLAMMVLSASSGFIGMASDPPSGEPNAVIDKGLGTTQSDEFGTTVHFTCEEVKQSTIKANDQVFTVLAAPGLDSLGSIGMPQLPYDSVHIAVPNEKVTVNVISDSYYEMAVGLVYPSQAPEPEVWLEDEPEFVMDADLYGTDAYYPADLTVMVEHGKVRGIPFVVLGFNAVQYNPVTGMARVHTTVDVEVTWDVTIPFSMDERLKSASFMDYYQNTFQNWDEFGSIYAAELAPDPSVSRGPTGCEYLIITDPTFLTAAETLADWKLERGIDTRVVDTTETGITQPEIAAYILDAYTTWTPAPSYVLLLGDADHINTNYVNVHPYYGRTTGTDIWYYTIDGADIFADIFYGRMPVDTAAQAENYVNKIVDYEIDPPYLSSFYENYTVAAYFQDTGDGYEDRRFVRTSEEVRDYLINNQSKSVERIYVTDAGTTPTNWNNDINYYGWPVPGAPIPPELLRSNGYPWDGDALDIEARVEAGTLVLNHRDHGSRPGWGDPYYQIPEIANLDNGELLPIVYSINCETGWFDHETDDAGYGTSTECFCEEFLRKMDGGCVCIFGATRVSYSGYNDFLCRGWWDAVYPDFDLSIDNGTPMYRMGQILNYGKWYMMNHYAWGDPWGYGELTSELFHVYGDPTMEMWTSEPQTMTVSHPSSYPFGTTQVLVNVSEEGALVSIVQDGLIFGTGYSSGGQCLVDVNPLLGGIAKVTVTKHNFRPYRGSIIVPSGPHDVAVKNLDVPATGVAGVAVNVNADVFNLGTNDETVIEVQLLVDGFQEDGVTLPFIASGNIEPVTLSWTPMFGGTYFVEVYAVPVTGEAVLWNNELNDTIFIVAYADIWVSPGGFDFVLQAGDTDSDTLTVGNSGLASLDYNLITLQGGGSVFDDYPTTTWNPAIWDTASFSGIPEINTLGVAEPTEPNSMELDGDGDTVVSVIYDTTASDSIAFEFYYELGGGGETPDSTDGLALEYYNSGGTWVEAWSVNGEGTSWTTYDHAFVDVTAADAYHGAFQFRFRSWGSGATFDDFYVDDLYFNYTVPVTDGWLQVLPEFGSVAPLSSTTVDVLVDSNPLAPGFHQSNITVVNNDPDENPILVPVNVTVLSAQHDVAVLDMTVEGSFEAGRPLWINGTVLNQGLNGEANVEVQLLVNMAFEDTTTIVSLPSSVQDQIYFIWIPPLGINYTLSLYIVPVPSEGVLINNWMNETVTIFALPDIALSPMSFDFVAAPGSTDVETLYVDNEGLAALDFQIKLPAVNPTVLYEGFSANPADWTITHISGTAWTWSSANQRMENTYGYPNEGYLDSPVMDCSGRTGTTLSFWHYWRADYSGGAQDGYVRGSIDGGSSWPYIIDEFHHNAPALEDMVKSYTLPWADGQSQVRVRFDVYNNDDWYWRMDDFNLSCNPLPTCDWLFIAPDTGTVPPIDQIPVTLTADAATLSPGIYFTNLTVTSNDLDEPQYTLPVTFTVAGPTTASVSVQIGWNFISTPLIPTDSNLPAALTDQGGDTTWDMVQYYDPSGPDHWKRYSTFSPPSLNDLNVIDESMGVWLHIPNAAALGDGILELAGIAPVTTVIHLTAGWNMVGYPCATPELASTTLPALADMVAVCDFMEPYCVRDADPTTVTMSEGNAYWVHVTGDCDWIVTY